MEKFSPLSREHRMTYPIYRKYPNNKSFFKITAPDRFEEVKLTGQSAELHVFEAKIFPDRQLIQDMTDLVGDYWEPSSEDEFNSNQSK